MVAERGVWRGGGAGDLAGAVAGPAWACGEGGCPRRVSAAGVEPGWEAGADGGGRGRHGPGGGSVVECGGAD